MLQTAQEVIASGDERAVVDYAVEVNREISRAQVELDEAKVFLRKLAAERRGADDDAVEIDGNLGVATVAFPARPDVKLRKGRDLRDIEVNLSEEGFRRLFVRTIQVRALEELPDLLEGLSKADRDAVDLFLEITPKTPKVNLTK